MTVETQKILDPSIEVVTRAGTDAVGHAEAVFIETEGPSTRSPRARDGGFPGLIMVDRKADEGYVARKRWRDGLRISRVRTDNRAMAWCSGVCRITRRAPR